MKFEAKLWHAIVVSVVLTVVGWYLQKAWFKD